MYCCLFVTKGRSSIADTLSFVFFSYILFFKKQFLTRILIFVSCFILICFLVEQYGFLLTDFVTGEISREGDYSGAIRRRTVERSIELLKGNYLLGIGNLSYQYNDGFTGLYEGNFYIEDIGIIGHILINGLFVALIEIVVLFYCFRILKNNQDSIPHDYYEAYTVLYLIALFGCVWNTGVTFFNIYDATKYAILLYPILIIQNNDLVESNEKDGNV